MSKNKPRSKLTKAITLIVAADILIIVFALLFNIDFSPSNLSNRLYRAWFKPSPIQTQALTYEQLVQQVTPAEGKTVLVEWSDMGQKLVKVGAIDLSKFEKHYQQLSPQQLEIIQGDDLHQITFTTENIQFWTNVLWSLGLTQQSKVLSEGPMANNSKTTPIANYASTGGWTLGTKPATTLYNSVNLIELTPEQQDQVYSIAENIFRPCCGNHTAFPDCNHGMAVLGLIELMVSQGAGEQEIYQAALDFNSYAFSGTYITLAAYLNQRGSSWQDTDPKTLLSPQYSSAQGANNIAKQVGEIPGAPQKGASCGA